MQPVVNSLHERRPFMNEYVQRIQWEREELSARLGRLQFEFLPSDSNFILLFPQHSFIFARTLQSLGIKTRTFDNPLLSNARRMTLPGEPNAFQRLEYAIELAASAIHNK